MCAYVCVLNRQVEWQSLEQRFRPAYDRMSALSATKPLAVETATNDMGGLGDKATWYTEAFATLLNNMTRVQQAVFVLRNETLPGADFDLNTANETAAFGTSLATLGWSSITLGSGGVNSSAAAAAIGPIVIPTAVPATAEPSTMEPTGNTPQKFIHLVNFQSNVTAASAHSRCLVLHE
jgi:hypothetical protein